jgi:hypothetical protein
MTDEVWSSFPRRVVGAVRLEPAMYEEVEADRRAGVQAVAVVLLSSLAAGIGASEGMTVGGFVARTVVALLSWGAWAAITFQIGGRLLPESQTKVDPGELLRTLGFAAAPGLVRIVGVLPGLSVAALIVSWVWMLAAMVVAVRQALDYQHTSRAILVCVVGGLVGFGLAVLLGVLLSTPVY